MNTEATEFNGWTYDREAEKAYTPLKIVKVALYIIGCSFAALCIVGVLKEIWEVVLPDRYGWFGFGGIVVGFTLLLVAKARMNQTPVCLRCRKPMKMVETSPTEHECETWKWSRSKSGHVYAPGAENGMVEIRKQWFCCQNCKRYFLLSARSEGPIISVEEREAHYTSFAEARELIASRQRSQKPPSRD